jgi:hypothetical protein
MRFARCADCNDYKYLLDDGKCKNCSSIEITSTMEIEKSNTKYKPDMKVEYHGDNRVLTDIIYSDTDGEWYYELDMGADFVSIEQGNKNFYKLKGGYI